MGGRRDRTWLRLGSLFCGVLIMGLAAQGHALVIDLIETGEDPVADLSAALLAAGSGISITAGSEDFVGRVGDGDLAQSGTYTGFNLVNQNNNGPDITNPDGIVLTTGTANIPQTNTFTSWDPTFPGTGSDSDLEAILLAASAPSTETNDTNYFSFDFTVDAGINSISADFVFGSDEFPDQSVTDVFAFIVDGANYAFFPDGSLVSFVEGVNAANFVDNDFGTDNYFLEYDGLSTSLHVTGLLDMSLSEHTLKIAIADTSDDVWDSGVFIGNLFAGVTEGTGGIGDDDTPGGDNGVAPVPEPGTILLLGAGLLGLIFTRRRMKN